MKIDYTNYLKRKPLEQDYQKATAMLRQTRQALTDAGEDARQYLIECYADGVSAAHRIVEGETEFYRCYDTVKGKWFSGAVGDH